MSFGPTLRNGISIALGATVSLSASKYFSPLVLFAGSVKGAWFDPSDITTLFQDSAGTTPVTAVEQPVGLMKDKSGNGKDALQATAGNRPTYRARYNLLTFSEDFTNAAWTKASVTPTTNATTDPLGGNTGNRWTEVAATTNHRTTIASLVATPPVGNSYTLSIYAKAAERSNIVAVFVVGAGFVTQNFNVSTGTVQAQGTSGGVATGTATITAAGGGWYRCTLVVTVAVSGALGTIGWDIAQDNTTATSYLGDITKGIYAWGADIKNGNVPNAAYQSITTATSYNAVGFLPYLAFNGTSSAMATAAIDFTGTKQMSVFDGTTVLGATSSAVVNLGSAALVAGDFLLWSKNVSAAQEWYAMGSATQVLLTESSPVATPYTAVMSMTGDLTASGSLGAGLTLRRNGSTDPTTPLGTPPGTGTFANDVLKIGVYNGANWFNGNLYQLVVRGAASTAGEIASTEAYVNGKTGAY
jgi:hypothetical protein